MNLACLVQVFLSSLLLMEVSCQSLPSLLVNLVAGPPINFKTVSWPIDPEAGIRRSKEYQAVNGKFGNKFVERLGLGEDGRTEERRIQQIIRDQKGELSYIPPPL